MTARILGVSPDEYHTLPGLSASIATTLITRSPRHAQHEIGKGKAPTAAMDFGTVVHAITLGKGKRYAPVPFEDWRTNAAKETREKFRAEGLVPLLHHQLTAAEQCAAAITEKLAVDHQIKLDGESELAIQWEEPSPHGPVICRCMMDHAWLVRGEILDLKIVENAETSQVERSAERFGYGIQQAAYKRAAAALDKRLAGRVKFAFAFGESEPPYALNVTEPDGKLRKLGELRWIRAVHEWARCHKEYGDKPWPDYGRNYLSAPAWALAREEI